MTESTGKTEKGICSRMQRAAAGFFYIGLTAELLLQCVGDTIRVFPAWPKGQDARFTDLRAQGGFLVSAEQKDGQVVRLEITSTVGGRLRLLHPRTGALTERDAMKRQSVQLLRNRALRAG